MGARTGFNPAGSRHRSRMKAKARPADPRFVATGGQMPEAIWDMSGSDIAEKPAPAAKYRGAARAASVRL